MRKACRDLRSKSWNKSREPKEVTYLLINHSEGQETDCDDVNVSRTASSMGHKGHYQRVLSKNSVTQDSRSQSLPNCLVDEKNKTRIEVANVEFCDTQDKLMPDSEPRPSSPVSEQWFKTWPERYDKIKSNDNNPELNSQNTDDTCETCDNVAINRVNCKLSLKEALQNISLAYSPVTKQLHLIENPSTSEDVDLKLDLKECKHESEISEKKGHKRTEGGSYSSTLSSLSNPSPSGSLLNVDERSLASSEDYGEHLSKNGLSHFFSRNVFAWKSDRSKPSSSRVWKLFRSSKECRSPQHVIASSSALIQHPRPSNLPAKTLEEEMRHQKEYEAMIAAAKKRDAQNTANKVKSRKLQLQQEEQQATTARYFIKYVLPNWEKLCDAKKTQDLWWQGLPSSIRGKVWRLAIGNELNITQQLYEICLSRAQSRLNSPAPSNGDCDIDQESSMDVIQLDISRTFPHLCIFQEGGPYSDILHSLLAAYVCYRPDVGYVQGMSYIAAILILNMEAFDAFICFANLLNQPLHLAAFTLNQEQMEAYYKAYNEVFSYNLPTLFTHFEDSRLTPDLYLLDWIYTIFAKAMPLDVACRVWDIFLRDGFEFIFRTALGILHLNQETLFDMDFLHGAQFLTRLPDDLSSEHLFKSIQAITTNIGKQTFSQIVDKYSLR